MSRIASNIDYNREVILGVREGNAGSALQFFRWLTIDKAGNKKDRALVIRALIEVVAAKKKMAEEAAALLNEIGNECLEIFGEVLNTDGHPWWCTVFDLADAMKDEPNRKRMEALVESHRRARRASH